MRTTGAALPHFTDTDAPVTAEPSALRSSTVALHGLLGLLPARVIITVGVMVFICSDSEEEERQGESRRMAVAGVKHLAIKGMPYPVEHASMFYHACLSANACCMEL